MRLPGVKLYLMAENRTPLIYMAIKIKRCPECGKEYKPLYSFCKVCFECYQRTKHAKIKVPKRMAEIDKKINEIQKVSRPLNDEEKAAIAYMLARFTPISEIQEYYRRDGGKEIAYESVKSIRDSQKWVPIIEKYRKEWLARVTEIPIANKRIRVEAWQTMLEKGMQSNKMKYVKDALVGARDELEGIQTQLGNSYNLTYIANMPDSELMTRKGELLEKLKRITGAMKRDEIQSPNEPLQVESEPEDIEVMIKE